VINAASGNNSFIRVYSIGARDNKEYVQMFAKQNLRYLEQLLCTPCDIEYRVYYPTPVEYTKLDVFLAEIGVHRPLCKPDFDNIEKSYSDAFSGNIWIDDIVVIDATIRKFFSILPRVEIDLKYANQLSNRYHYRNMTNRKDFTKEMKVSYFGGKTNDDESV
jgi:Holliday junction resolvase RusA-like endonuclease